MPVNSIVPRWLLLFSFRLWDCDETSERFIAVSKLLVVVLCHISLNNPLQRRFLHPSTSLLPALSSRLFLVKGFELGWSHLEAIQIGAVEADTQDCSLEIERL